jgi:transcriptional regulator with XRE-family HTH domain
MVQTVNLIGELLKRARENASIQQKDLALAAGVPASRLSRIENGIIEPDREELMSILASIDTAESRNLATDLEFSPRYVDTLHWHELSAPEREALRHADSALDELISHRTSPEFPKTLLHYSNDLEEKIRDGIKYLSLVDHRIAFVGPIGVGKSSAINSLFALTDTSRKSRDGRIGGKTGLPPGLLPTGSGRVTAFEYRIAYGPQTRILIHPESELVIRRDLRSLCEYWLAEVREREKPTRPLPEELERVYRNMAGLSESEGQDDPVKSLMTSEIVEVDDLLSVILQKINLSARKKTELVFEADSKRDASSSEAEWIRKHLRQINLGRLSDFSLPKSVTLILNNQRLKNAGYTLTIIDTRGLDESVSREDLAEVENDPYTLCVLCSGFKDAPTRAILNEIERAKTRRYETLEKKRFALLILPQGDEAVQLTTNEDDDLIDQEQGYLRRARQVQKALAGDASNIDVFLFDAMVDSPDDALIRMWGRIGEIRDVVRQEMLAACDSVDVLINQQAKVQFEECQRRVREKFEWFIKEFRVLEQPMTPIYIGVLEEVMACHASSIYSATRYSGEGRTVSFYHIFNMQVRESANGMAAPAVSGLKTLLREMRDNWDPKRTDTKQSRTYIRDLIMSIDRKLKDFVEHAQSIGDISFRPFFENDEELWVDCLKQRGQGSGYRDRVAKVIKQWFTDHKEVLKRVDKEIQKAWQEVFMGWVNEVIGES